MRLVVIVVAAWCVVRCLTRFVWATRDVYPRRVVYGIQDDAIAGMLYLGAALWAMTLLGPQ